MQVAAFLRRNWLLRVAVVPLLLAPAVAWANGPEVGFDAGTIFPVRSRSIQLVSERVDVRLAPYGSSDGTPNTSCLYVLRNLSDSTQRFRMAFVTSPPVTDDPGVYEAAQFSVYQDGHRREVRFLPGRGDEFRTRFGVAQDTFPTWELVIGPHEISRVSMKYLVQWSGGCDGMSCGCDFTYFARPAALWAGPIERATFRLHVEDRAFVRHLRQAGAPWSVAVSPGTARWESDGLTWAFRNWEPESDLQLQVEWPDSESGGNELSRSPWAPDSVAQMPPR